MSELTLGQAAPDFQALTQDGQTLSLGTLRGKTVVLYFYPKDDTPGCTTEGQEFTALYPKFQALGAEVVGVSKDSVASHHKFACKYDFAFPLLADTEEQICQAYGVIKEKQNYGKTYLGIERSTFVIDPEGVLIHLQRKVKAAGHAAAILKMLEERAQG